MSTLTKMFAIVSETVFQGLTASSGDIYATEAEAKKEHEDIKKMRVEGGVPEEDSDEDGYMVIPVLVYDDGRIEDETGRKISVLDDGNGESWAIELTKKIVVLVNSDNPVIAKAIARSGHSEHWEHAEPLLVVNLDAPQDAQAPGTPLNELQRKVLNSYAGGDFAHFQYEEEADNCGDSLVKFLLHEAHDAFGDPEEFARMMDTAIRQLDEVKQHIEADATTSRPSQQG